MMRRFTRRRRGAPRKGSSAAPIDSASAMERIEGSEGVPVTSLTVLEADEIPADFAAVGKGEGSDGKPAIVTFAPARAEDALLAALAVGGRLAETEDFAGDVFAVAPEWTAPGRRLLGLVGQLPFQLRAVTVPELADRGLSVTPEAPAAAVVLMPEQIAGQLSSPADRDLFARATRGLEGLAAKHGGALRGCGRAVELVLMARRVAELRAEDGVLLTTLWPQRTSVELTAATVSNALDALEGQLRKRLNDRRVDDGEEGLRTRAISAFRNWHSLRAFVSWPLGGGDSEILDWVGVDVEGRPVIGAARRLLTLREIGEIVAASLQLRPALSIVLAHAAAPVVLDAPRLVVGGREIGAGVHRVLNSLTLAHELFEMRAGRDGTFELIPVAAGEAPARERPARRPRRGGRRPRSEEGAESGAPAAEAATGEGGEGERGSSTDGTTGRPDEESSGRPNRSRRGRGRRGRGRRDGGSRASGSDEPDRDASSDAGDRPGRPERPAPQFEEVSMFDLDEDQGDKPDRSRRRRAGRGRGRGRGRAGGADEDSRVDASDDVGSSGDSDAPAATGRGDRRPDGATPAGSEADQGFDLTDDEDLELAEIPEEMPDFEPEAPAYEEDLPAAASAESVESEATEAPGVSVAESAAEGEQLVFPRRRGAIIVHADRDSVIAAILLARDIRMVDGFWVYPQSELMNVFRTVTTGLRDNVTIYVIGFAPSPARDVIQAASLYRGRISWFDHRDWPPEDLQGLRDAIGEEAVYATPGVGSSIPKIFECCSRRSRFTDKLVDLAAGRFTLHDYERWGRLWWWRLGQVVEKTGECRADVDLLLSGRPSDLAREASNVDVPPVPPEVPYVSARDFRLVHFAGHVLVVLEVPPELDIHLAARVARERYDASLSLAHRPGGELVVFGGEELSGRRTLDLGGLVEHVSQKLEWVDLLLSADHVARFRARGLASQPERLDEIIAEIAMSRSILDG